jgi:hypothetical protein
MLNTCITVLGCYWHEREKYSMIILDQMLHVGYEEILFLKSFKPSRKKSISKSGST